MHKHTSKWLILILILATGIARADNEDTSTPEALISRARLKDIWTDGTPAMLMRSEIQVADPKGTLVTGDYIFNWVSPSQWREEIRFANYDRIRVRNANGYWQKSELNYKPEFMFQVDALLHLRDMLKLASSEIFGKVKNRDKNGVQQKCIEVKSNKRTQQTLCFDDRTGALLSIEYPILEIPPEISRIEYRAFGALGGKLIPYEVLALNDGKIVVGVKVQNISKVTEENPELFKPAANSEFWAQCDDMSQPELLNHVYPEYPPGARANRRSGRVILYAVIEADGSVSHLAVIKSAARDLDVAALQGVRQWRYKPAACGQTPIRTETSMHIDFWLRY